MPMPLNFLLDIDLVDGKTIIDGIGVAGLPVKKAGFQVERIGQAMSGIDAHYQGAVTETRQLQPRSGGKTGFSDASFAAEKQDPHTSF